MKLFILAFVGIIAFVISTAVAKRRDWDDIVAGGNDWLHAAIDRAKKGFSDAEALSILEDEEASHDFQDGEENTSMDIPDNEEFVEDGGPNDYWENGYYDEIYKGYDYGDYVDSGDYKVEDQEAHWVDQADVPYKEAAADDYYEYSNETPIYEEIHPLTTRSEDSAETDSKDVRGSLQQVLEHDEPREDGLQADSKEVVEQDSPQELVVPDSPKEFLVHDSTQEVVMKDSPEEVAVKDSPEEVVVKDAPEEVGVKDVPRKPDVKDAPKMVDEDPQEVGLPIENVPVHEDTAEHTSDSENETPEASEYNVIWDFLVNDDESFAKMDELLFEGIQDDVYNDYDEYKDVIDGEDDTGDTTHMYGEEDDWYTRF